MGLGELGLLGRSSIEGGGGDADLGAQSLGQDVAAVSWGSGGCRVVGYSLPRREGEDRACGSGKSLGVATLESFGVSSGPNWIGDRFSLSVCSRQLGECKSRGRI